MKQWFYSENESQQGPVGEDVLVHRFRSGDLGQDSLVWAEGMKDWVAAAEIKEFSFPVEASVVSAGSVMDGARVVGGSASPYAPPLVESEVVSAPQLISGSQVRPWIRFWARTLDVMIFGVVVGVAIGLLIPEALDMLDGLFNVLILGVICLVESVFLTLFGTTPGKAIFRISVRHADGSRLSFPEALVRSLRVLYRGLGLGIPLVSMITQIVACNRLSNNGITSWDRDANLTVGHQKIQAWRWLVILLLIGGFCALVGYGTTA